MADYLHPMLADELRRELASSERLRWMGAPSAGPMMLATVPMFLFGAFWAVVVVLALAHGQPSADNLRPVIYTIFLVVAAAMVVKPFLAWRRAAHIGYAITDRRLLILDTSFGRSVRAIPLDQIRSVEKKSRFGSTTLRLPMGRVPDGEGGTKMDYVDLVGLADADAPWALLNRR